MMGKTMTQKIIVPLSPEICDVTLGCEVKAPAQRLLNWNLEERGWGEKEAYPHSAKQVGYLSSSQETFIPHEINSGHSQIDTQF